MLVLAASCDSSSSSSSSWLGLIDRHCHNLARPFPCTFASIHDNSQSQQQQQQQQYRSSAEAADEDSLEQRLSQARNVGLYQYADAAVSPAGHAHSHNCVRHSSSRGDYLLFLNAGERLSSSAIEKLSLLAVSAQPAWITFGWTVVDTENLAAAPAAASSASSFAAIDREMLESRDLPPTMLVARSVVRRQSRPLIVRAMRSSRSLTRCVQLLELGAFDSDFDGNSMHDLMVRMLGLDLTHLRGIMLPEVLLELPPPPPSPSREPQLHLKRKPTVADMRLLLARNPRSASLALTVPTYVPNYRRLLDTREQERGLMELVLERPFSDYYRRLLTPSLQFQSGRRLNAPVWHAVDLASHSRTHSRTHSCTHAGAIRSGRLERHGTCHHHVSDPEHARGRWRRAHRLAHRIALALERRRPADASRARGRVATAQAHRAVGHQPASLARSLRAPPRRREPALPRPRDRSRARVRRAPAPPSARAPRDLSRRAAALQPQHLHWLQPRQALADAEALPVGGARRLDPSLRAARGRVGALLGTVPLASRREIRHLQRPTRPHGTTPSPLTHIVPINQIHLSHSLARSPSTSCRPPAPARHRSMSSTTVWTWSSLPP